MQSLLTQGEIIAGAIASSATVETDTITIDPDRLLQMQAGETDRLGEDGHSPLEFSINPERVAPLLRRLVTPTRTRARIYDREGALLLDSAVFPAAGRHPALRPSARCRRTMPSLIERAWTHLRGLFRRGDSPPLEDIGPPNGKTLPEVQQALGGRPARIVRRNERRRDDRLRRGADAALPLGARRAAAVDAGRRHRRASSRPSASRCCRSSSSRPS